VSDQNEIFVIEVNPNCYLEASAEFAMAAAAADMSHPALIHSIIDLAVARYHR
jgi:D-alanine-D-alanine ligase